jgi:23S rRNA (uridine2552-2'-O)-methyltransferase
VPKQFVVQDRYFKKAKDEGYRARSVFKLESIQNRFHVLKPGDRVLDLGAAPGSFLQYISKVIGEKGIAIGIDLQEIKPLKRNNIFTYTGDICDDALVRRIISSHAVREFDVVTSDLAPKTSGIKFLDAGRSLELNLQVLDIAGKYLKKGGNAVMKILPGFNEGDLTSKASKMFRTVKKFRPEAIRKSSGESYIVCIGKI